MKLENKNYYFFEMSSYEFKCIQDTFTNSNFYQTVEWACLKEMNGWNSSFLGVKVKNKILLACLVLSKNVFFGKKIYYAPRGILCNSNDYEVFTYFTNEIIKYLKSNDGILFKIDPLVEYEVYNSNGETILTNNKGKDIYTNLLKLNYHHNGFTVGYSKEAQFRWTFIMDLKRSIDDIYMGMNKRCRRCIKKSYKYPTIMVDVNDNNINDFKAIMEHTCKRQNHFDRSKEYYVMMAKCLKKKIKMVIIYLDRDKYFKNISKEDKLYEVVSRDSRSMIPVSAGVFIFDNNRTNYVYGGAISSYMPLMSTYKMQMEMILFSRSRGIELYDFGGISGDFDKNSPNYGIYDFKRGFGGKVIEYIGEFDLIINKKLYNIYNLSYGMYRYIKKHIFKHYI